MTHLRLPDQIVLEFTDELEVLAPVARGARRKRGLLWQGNAHLQVGTKRHTGGRFSPALRVLSAGSIRWASESE